MKLNFKITFKKGIAGIENEMYHACAKDQIYCSECGKQFKEGNIYYYWVCNDLSCEPAPTDDSEYLLCPRCASKRH